MSLASFQNAGIGTGIIILGQYERANFTPLKISKCDIDELVLCLTELLPKIDESLKWETKVFWSHGEPLSILNRCSAYYLIRGNFSDKKIKSDCGMYPIRSDSGIVNIKSTEVDIVRDTYRILLRHDFVQQDWFEIEPDVLGWSKKVVKMAGYEDANQKDIVVIQARVLINDTVYSSLICLKEVSTLEEVLLSLNTCFGAYVKKWNEIWFLNEDTTRRTRIISDADARILEKKGVLVALGE